MTVYPDVVGRWRASRIKAVVQWTMAPASGFAMDGEPWALWAKRYA